MYEFVDIKWNPLAGECFHRCGYCSTESFKRYPGCKTKYSGLPRIDENQISKNLGKDKFVFVVSQNDLFACDVKKEIIDEIVYRCRKSDSTFLFQTKNPFRLHEMLNDILFPEKSIFCITLESNRHYKDKMGFAPSPFHRYLSIVDIRKEFPKLDFHVTIEPIMNFDLKAFVEILRVIMPSQVNIGADSKRNNLIEPSKDKILALIAELEKFTKVVQKSNLKRLLK